MSWRKTKSRFLHGQGSSKDAENGKNNGEDDTREDSTHGRVRVGSRRDGDDRGDGGGTVGAAGAEGFGPAIAEHGENDLAGVLADVVGNLNTLAKGDVGTLLQC